jgi:hypothetical protein
MSHDVNTEQHRTTCMLLFALQVQQLRAGSYIGSLFKLPTAEEVLENLKVGADPVGPLADGGAPDLEAGAAASGGSSSSSSRSAAAATSILRSKLTSAASGLLSRRGGQAGSFSSAAALAGSGAGSGSAALRGGVAPRVWLVVAYVALLHLVLMIAFTTKAPNPGQMAAMCTEWASAHGHLQAVGSGGGSSSAGGAAAAAVAAAAQHVGGGMTMTALERATALPG